MIIKWRAEFFTTDSQSLMALPQLLCFLSFLRRMLFFKDTRWLGGYSPSCAETSSTSWECHLVCTHKKRASLYVWQRLLLFGGDEFGAASNFVLVPILGQRRRPLIPLFHTHFLDVHKSQHFFPSFSPIAFPKPVTRIFIWIFSSWDHLLL